MLSMLVPILLVLGAPVTLALRALPSRGPSRAPGTARVAAGRRALPVGAVLHPPAGRAAAVRRQLLRASTSPGCSRRRCRCTGAHLAMNLHFLVIGLLFFWPLIGIDPSPRRVPPAARLGIVFASVPFHAFFGVALMSADTVIGGGFYRALALPWVTDPLRRPAARRRPRVGLGRAAAASRGDRLARAVVAPGRAVGSSRRPPGRRGR